MNGIVDEYSRRLQNISISEDMEIVSRDKKFQTLLREAEIVAETDVPVLICGENGVGKEVVANYIYKCSRRRKHPMITVNCAAIPPDLMESELFGYEEGAFTGALKGGKKENSNLQTKVRFSLMTFYEAGILGVFLALTIGLVGGFLHTVFGVHTGVQFMTYYASAWIVTQILALAQILV